jgi:hypothetical protein
MAHASKKDHHLGIAGHWHPETNAGISIPASIISVQYRTEKMPDCLAWFGTGTVPASLVFFIPVPD